METKSTGYDLSVSVNGFNISYDDVGEGKFPIIFLHGYPFDKSMWELQLEFLRSSYRLIAIDFRGFGKSKDEETPLSIELFAEDLVAFMDVLSIKKAVVCGLSMGGYIALNAERRFPERFEALILADTQCNADSPEAKKKRYKTIEEVEENGTAEFGEGFIKKVFFKDTIFTNPGIVEQLKAVVLSNSQQIIVQGMVALAEREETCSSLEDITIPTLIICGREDEVTPVAQSETMHAAIKKSTLKVIDNAGHVSNLDQPHEFAKVLSEFLSGLIGVGTEEE